jgi:hypothetical protein
MGIGWAKKTFFTGRGGGGQAGYSPFILLILGGSATFTADGDPGLLGVGVGHTEWNRFDQAEFRGGFWGHDGLPLDRVCAIGA